MINLTADKIEKTFSFCFNEFGSVPSWKYYNRKQCIGEQASKYRSFIKGCLTPNVSQALTLGRNSSSFLGSPRFTGEVVALRFEFL